MPDPTREQLSQIGDDAEVREFVEGVKALTPLRETPGWRYLLKRFSTYRKNVSERLGSRIISGVELTEREIGHAIGYAAAINDLLHFPERMDEEFEKAAERSYQRLLAQEEESSEAPPYE